jgi:hypothetical protein
MTIKNAMAGLLVMSMITTSFPALAASEEGEPAVVSQPMTAKNAAPGMPGALRGSLARAIDSATIAETKSGPLRSHSRSLLAPEFATASGSGAGAGAGNGMGGGMSTVSTVMMVVGTVVGIGATVYMVKQLKKTTATPTPTQ